jgi:hypothetical protein
VTREELLARLVAERWPRAAVLAEEHGDAYQVQGISVDVDPHVAAEELLIRMRAELAAIAGRRRVLRAHGAAAPNLPPPPGAFSGDTQEERKAAWVRYFERANGAA